MFAGLLGNSIEQILAAESFIEAHEVFSKTQPIERQALCRLYGVSSCVTRLYAIYERFVESIISDYLDALPEVTPYASLPDGLKNEYRFGISYLLSRIHTERYANLKHENVIRWYHEALTDFEKYRFVAEALTRHDQNLRLNVVAALMSRIGLVGFQDWISKSSEILSLYEEKASVFEQLAAELRAFVQIRNDAAHGVLEELQGKEVLLRYCELVRAVVNSITAYVYRGLLQKRVEAGRVVKIGRVTEVFERRGAFVATLDVERQVYCGELIHFVGASYCVGFKVDSLQVEGTNVQQATSEYDNFEVGIKCRSLPRRKSEIYVDIADQN